MLRRVAGQLACCLAVLALPAVGCVPFESVPLDGFEQPVVAEDRGLAGNIWVVEEPHELGAVSGEKTLIVTYRFTSEAVEALDQRIVFGTGRAPRSDGFDFRLVLYDRGGSELTDYRIRDPRRLLVERHGVVELPARLYSARFPFETEAQEVRVFDRRGRLLVRTAVQPIIQTYCREHPDDC